MDTRDPSKFLVIQYHWDSAAVLQKGEVECSLVTSVGQGAQGSYGHIIEVPGFGKVSLAELTVDHAFHLTMVTIDSDRTGKLKIADVLSNGTHHP